MIHTICWYSKGFPLIINGESQQRKSLPTFWANHKLAYRPVTIASTLLFWPDCGNGPRQTPDFFSRSHAPYRRLIGRKPRAKARPDSIKNESNRSITKKLATKKYLISVFFAYATSFFSKIGKPSKQAKNAIRVGQTPMLHCISFSKKYHDLKKLFIPTRFWQSKTHSENRLKKQLITDLN